MTTDIELANLLVTLGGLPAQDVLRLTHDRFPEALAISSSFETDSLPLLHLVATTVPEVPVLFLDTGYHFAETLRFRDRMVREWGLKLRVLRAGVDAAEPEMARGQPLYRTNPDLCCALHKVEPVRAAMREYKAWITSTRSDQSGAPDLARVVERTPRGLLRIYPLLDWTTADVEHYLRERNLPRHPLSDLGYSSIGCQPCTRPPLAARDGRGGPGPVNTLTSLLNRWRGMRPGEE